MTVFSNSVKKRIKEKNNSECLKNEKLNSVNNSKKKIHEIKSGNTDSISKREKTLSPMAIIKLSNYDLKYLLVSKSLSHKNNLDVAQLAELYGKIEKRKFHIKLYSIQKKEVNVSDSTRWLK
ncbi:hypothetical protein CWI38_1089p0020 [Hamiltosporidium tvaerminnensis]|uniref:Uncharacterized protein n=1 Tax=Hamiltosporidium tvaerminnensis TaxID=1176355 RepID=A0A4V2JXH0_9MICR|nr:hypothetical protein CWI38_1089p0020 [Hamiltosporidium tvaerminnensis]